MTEVLTQEAPAENAGLSLDRAGTRPMLTSAQIARRVHRLGKQISNVYADIDTPLVMVVILKGATVFAADRCAACPSRPSSSSCARRATRRGRRAAAG